MKFVPLSSNSKLGKVAATYRNIKETCPTSCALMNNGCYAQRGHTGIHQKNSVGVNNVTNMVPHKDALGVRLNVSGDFLYNSLNGPVVDILYIKQCNELANKINIPVWGYTHAWKYMYPEIFDKVVILVSCDTKEDKKEAHELGWTRTVRVIDKPQDREKNEVLCPIDYAKYVGVKVKDIKTNCIECRLCFREKPLDIAFLKT